MKSPTTLRRPAAVLLLLVALTCPPGTRGAGAGSVYVRGRDHLELKNGSELSARARRGNW
jgi:hypothetical protein